MIWHLKQKLHRMSRRAAPEREFVLALEQKIRQAHPHAVREKLSAWKTAFASSFLVFSLGAGTAAYAYTSDDVLPDHPLYPLRTQIEKIEAHLAVSEEHRDQIRLKHLQRRMHETQLMSLKEKPISSQQAHIILNDLNEVVQKQADATTTDAEQYLKEVVGVEENELTEIIDQQKEAESSQDHKALSRQLIEQVDKIRQHVDSLEEHRQATRVKSKSHVVPSDTDEGDDDVQAENVFQLD